MSQQINLYNSSLLEQGAWLTAGRLVRILLSITAGLVIASLALAYHLHTSRQQLQVLKGRLGKAQQALASETAALQARKRNTGLQQQRQQVQQLADQHQRVLAQLEAGLATHPPGYSTYMQALARQSFDGLWLTGFDIAATGGIDISGRTLKPEFLPLYIARLKREPIMQGKTFATLEMGSSTPARAAGGDAPATDSSAIVFSLHSQYAEKGQ